MVYVVVDSCCVRVEDVSRLYASWLSNVDVCRDGYDEEKEEEEDDMEEVVGAFLTSRLFRPYLCDCNII